MNKYVEAYLHGVVMAILFLIFFTIMFGVISATFMFPHIAIPFWILVGVPAIYVFTEVD